MLFSESVRRLLWRIRNVTTLGVRIKPPLPDVPDIESKRFLFICGLHRSGTSILYKALCEHPRISGFANTGVPEDEGQHLQTVYPTGLSFGGAGRFACDLRSHLTESSELATVEARDELLRQWGAYFDLSAPLLIEKSPPNLVRARYLQALFPDAQFVFIVRHPIPVALATEKWAKTSVMELILHWFVAHEIMLGDLRSVRRCMVFRYEDFIRSPSQYLKMICDSVGLEEFSTSKIITDQNQKYFEIWEGLDKSIVEISKSVFDWDNATCRRFGYSISSPYWDRAQFGNIK